MGWYQTAYDRSGVIESRLGRETLLKEVLDHYEGQGHDFSQYDNGGDGTIDYFIVIWAGPDTGWGNFWWGYQTIFSDNTYTLDGVQLGKYSWQWEARPVRSIFTPLVVIHESGNGFADAGDFYKQGDAMGFCTTPSSKQYDGTDSGVEINNIAAPGLQMTANFSVTPAAESQKCGRHPRLLGCF